ncbi:hypothetical protein EIN_058570 [Entamoeba invadens IP1]|uniref:hypothetical protein n=1 Tax=Entamoeba invadens IP1 TaxID=370355 RepID=UPI0002C3DD5F|nr:hypothetical protein EIN_058570 [Entamoeba invadens IP1]ELP93402.1 hypothetical protein EIN_058570 [Entamoeba invadens IP1]|eukprot:XP_004260173.1 hypothetical protein EIN_058570 [Entamoeba invadens IP1]
MSFKERLQCIVLTPIEIEVEKITRDDNAQVKEKHIKKIYDFIDGKFDCPEIFKKALLKRFNQKFTRKQFTHFLYFMMRTIFTKYAETVFSVFTDMSTPFYLKQLNIEEDEHSLLNLAVAKYLDNHILLLVNNKTTLTADTPLWNNTYCSIRTKMNFVSIAERVDDMSEDLLSIDLTEDIYYDTPTSLDFIEIILKNLFLCSHTLIRIQEVVFENFVSVEDEIYEKFIIITEKFMSFSKKINESFTLQMIKSYFRDFPSVECIDLSTFFDLLKKKFEVDKKLAQKIPVKRIDYAVIVNVCAPLMQKFGTITQQGAEFLQTPATRQTRAKSTPRKKQIKSRSHNSLSRNAYSSSNSLSSSPSNSAFYSPTKQHKGEKSMLMCSADVNEDTFVF